MGVRVRIPDTGTLHSCFEGFFLAFPAWESYCLVVLFAFLPKSQPNAIIKCIINIRGLELDEL